MAEFDTVRTYEIVIDESGGVWSRGAQGHPLFRTREGAWIKGDAARLSRIAFRLSVASNWGVDPNPKTKRGDIDLVNAFFGQNPNLKFVTLDEVPNDTMFAYFDSEANAWAFAWKDRGSGSIWPSNAEQTDLGPRYGSDLAKSLAGKRVIVLTTIGYSDRKLAITAAFNQFKSLTAANMPTTTSKEDSKVAAAPTNASGTPETPIQTAASMIGADPTLNMIFSGGLNASKIVISTQAARLLVTIGEKALKRVLPPEHHAMLELPIVKDFLVIIGATVVHMAATHTNILPKKELIAVASAAAYEGQLIRMGFNYTDAIAAVALDIAGDFNSLADLGEKLLPANKVHTVEEAVERQAVREKVPA